MWAGEPVMTIFEQRLWLLTIETGSRKKKKEREANLS